MRNSSPLITTVSSPKPSVPRALWIGGGLLCLVAAALAGTVLTPLLAALLVKSLAVTGVEHR